MGEYVDTKKQRDEFLKAKGLMKDGEDPHRDRWV